MKVSKKVPLIVYSTLGLLILVALLVLLGNLLNRGTIGGADGPTGIIVGRDSSSRQQGGVLEGTYRYLGESAETYSIGVFDEYEIDIPYGEVTIRPAKDAEPSVRIESDLNIEMRIRADGNTGKIDFDMIGSHWFGSSRTRIDFCLPESRFHELELNLSAGTLDLSGITADKLDIDVSAGKAEVSDCTFDEISSDMAAGELILRTGDAVRKIDCDVTAGSTKLYLPEDIGGFKLNYETTVGGFRDSTGLSLSGSESNELIGRKGRWTYGNEFCKIDLEVTAGELVLSTY